MSELLDNLAAYCLVVAVVFGGATLFTMIALAFEHRDRNRGT